MNIVKIRVATSSGSLPVSVVHFNKNGKENTILLHDIQNVCSGNFGKDLMEFLNIQKNPVVESVSNPVGFVGHSEMENKKR